MSKPALPMVLGTGPLADAARRMIAEDPDRYRPQSISMDPVGHCPCCDRDVYRVRSRVTAFEEGFATGLEDDAIVHPRLNDDGMPDPQGEFAGGCIPLERISEWKVQPGTDRCRVCACTEDRACPMGCWWVEEPKDGKPGLCSACAPTSAPKKKTTRRRK